MSDPANKGSNLILIGFMGTGKSTVGKRVAQSLDSTFVDTDDEIVKREKMSIPALFEERGEDEFRRIETEVLAECCHGQKQVIATGGGVVTREENHALLKEGGYVIWLKASPEVIYERVRRNDQRPLLETDDPEKTIRELLLSREHWYEGCADLTIFTDDLSLEETIYGVTETARYWRLEGRI